MTDDSRLTKRDLGILLSHALRLGRDDDHAHEEWVQKKLTERQAQIESFAPRKAVPAARKFAWLEALVATLEARLTEVIAPATAGAFAADRAAARQQPKIAWVQAGGRYALAFDRGSRRACVTAAYAIPAGAQLAWPVGEGEVKVETIGEDGRVEGLRLAQFTKLTTTVADGRGMPIVIATDE